MCVQNIPSRHSLQELIKLLVLQPREVVVDVHLDLSSFEPHELRQKLLEVRLQLHQMLRQETPPQLMQLLHIQFLEAILQKIVQQL